MTTTTVLTIPTVKQVQWLVDRAREEGSVVSCYVDKSVAVPPTWQTRLARELRDAKALAPNAAARRFLAAQVAVVQSVVSSRAARRARGVAVFVDDANGLVRAFLLDEPIADRLVVDEDPYVVPLVEYLQRHRLYLAVQTDTHRGALYAAGRGGAHLLAALDENVPKRHRAGVETWGKQQATIARHREDHMLHYRKELVREIARAWAETTYHGIVLLGEHEVLAHLLADLPPELAGRVVFQGPHGFTGKGSSIAAVAATVSARAAREHDERMLHELRVRLREASDVVFGPQEVLGALRAGQIGHGGWIALEADPGASAARCVRCGWVFAAPHDACSFCQGACERTNLWQSIVLLATGHGVPIHFLGTDAELHARGGVAAHVTRADPWESASAPQAEPATAS